MSFDTLFSSIYRLYYKGDERAAFLKDGTLALDVGEAEKALLKDIDPERLKRVVELHGEDIWSGWYSQRFGATWEALRLILGAKTNGEVVRRLCASDAFEKRVNDDRHGDALAAFIAEERSKDPERFAGTKWLDSLLEYELMMSQEISEDFVALLGNFSARVDWLVQDKRPWKKLPATKRVSKRYRALIGFCPEYGISEIEIASELCFGVLSRMLGLECPEEELIAKASQKQIVALEEECTELLEEMAAG